MERLKELGNRTCNQIAKKFLKVVTGYSDETIDFVAEIAPTSPESVPKTKERVDKEVADLKAKLESRQVQPGE